METQLNEAKKHIAQQVSLLNASTERESALGLKLSGSEEVFYKLFCVLLLVFSTFIVLTINQYCQNCSSLEAQLAALRVSIHLIFFFWLGSFCVIYLI